MIIRSMTAAVLGLAIVAAAATPVAEFPRSDAKTPLAKTETLSVPNLNPREGTLCFKFCPEWAPYSYRPSKIIELRFAPDFAISFHKGISQPNYCYLNVGGPLNTASSFPSDNLFTAGQWRSYAVRWSKARDRAEVVVDGFVAGSGPGSTGRYACELPGVVTGALRLEGDSRGAFKDVKVFDRYLEGQEFLGACGLKEAQQYLQWQRPPPGGTQSYGDVGGYSYVDPATGRTIAVAGSSGGATVPYNPARMPDLPSAPHTPWAKPLPGGPLKALFVLPTGFYSSNSMVGEVAELWRRLDMDCEATDTLTDEIANKRYDVIAVSHQGYGGRKFRAWDDLDENLRRWVIDQVKGGKSGLLHAYTDPYPQLPRPLRGEIAALYAPKARAAVAPVLRGFPGEAMHRINFFGNNRYDKVYELEDGWFLDTDDFAKNIVEVFDHGNAVAVKLNYVCSHWEGANTMAFVPNTALNAAATDVDYDHWQALAVRALLVAARRAPEATIAELEIKDGACAARLQGLRQPAKLWCRIQDRWGKVFAERTIPVAGDGKVELPLPASTPPRAFVDLVLRDGQGAALDFFSAATPPAQGSRVVGVSLDKDYYQRGDTVLAAVEIAGGARGRRRVVCLAHRLARTAHRPAGNPCHPAARPATPRGQSGHPRIGLQPPAAAGGRLAPGRPGGGRQRRRPARAGGKLRRLLHRRIRRGNEHLPGPPDPRPVTRRVRPGLFLHDQQMPQHQLRQREPPHTSAGVAFQRLPLAKGLRGVDEAVGGLLPREPRERPRASEALPSPHVQPGRGTPPDHL